MSCPDCYKGTIHEGKPTGEVTQIYGLKTYVAQPTNGRPVSGIVVFIPDAYGWEFNNNRLLADRFANQGAFKVYLPDFMNGHASPVWMIETFRTLYNPGSFLSKLISVPQAVYGFLPFLILNRPGKTYAVVKNFFLELRKDEGASLPVGAAGYCWGGKHLVLLAGDNTKVDGRNLIDAGFAGHPSLLAFPADIENIKVPVSFAIGDKDPLVSPDQCQQIEQIIGEKAEGQKGEIVTYPNCGHGFCVRADTKFVDVQEQASKAAEQCVQWLGKHFIAP